MTQPTGSALHRAMACHASMFLPQTREPSGDAATTGIIIHRYLELVVKNASPANALLDVANTYSGHEALDRCAGLEIPSHRPEFDRTDAIAEISFAYDVAADASRIVGVGLNREYGELAPYEIAMTLDVVVQPADNEPLRVTDWKTGHVRLGPPEEYAQLLVGALAACRHYNVTECIVAFGWVGDSEIYFQEAHLDTFTLESFAADLRQYQKDAAEVALLIGRGGTPDVVAGSHCQYCPAFYSCPSTTALVRQLPGLDGQTLTRSKMGEAWVKLKSYRKAIGVMERAIRAEAEMEPITLPTGKTLGMDSWDGNEKLDGRISHDAVLAITGDRSVADTAVSFVATKAGIRRALKTVAPNGTLSATTKEVLDEIRNSGGATRPRKREVREY